MSDETMERLLAGIRERDDDAAALRFINGWLASFREAIAQGIEARSQDMTDGVGIGMGIAAAIVRGDSA